MLTVVGSRTYIQITDVEFIKKVLSKYPETIRSEAFFTIDEEAINDKTKYDFVEVTLPENIAWLRTQGSWLLVEADFNLLGNKEFEKNIKTLNEGFEYTYNGFSDEELKRIGTFPDKAKTKFKIEAMEALLANRKGDKGIRFHYPARVEEDMAPKPKTGLRSRISALFRHV